MKAAISTLKDIWFLVSVASFFIVATFTVVSIFQTKAQAQADKEVIIKRLEKAEEKADTVSVIICATAIDLKWPTVKEACNAKKIE